jgi:hypothetical protein
MHLIRPMPPRKMIMARISCISLTSPPCESPVNSLFRICLLNCLDPSTEENQNPSRRERSTEAIENRVETHEWISASSDFMWREVSLFGSVAEAVILQSLNH